MKPKYFFFLLFCSGETPEIMIYIINLELYKPEMSFQIMYNYC